MSMTLLSQLAIIPAFLFTLAGLLALHGQDEEKAARRFLLFLLVAGVLMLLAVVVTQAPPNTPHRPLSFQLTTLLIPTILGTLALISLNLKWLRSMNPRIRMIALLLLGLGLLLFGLLWNSRWGVEYIILPGTVVLVIGWSLGRRYRRLAVVLGIVALLFLFLISQLIHGPPPTAVPPTWLLIPLVLVLSALPGLIVVIPALLISECAQPASVAERSSMWSDLVCIFRFGLALALLSYLVYIIFWGSVWDQTSDGLSGLMISQPTGATAIAAGMVMVVTLKGKVQLAGVAFMLLVPLLLFQAFEAGWRVSYHEITEGRAARIAQALEQFQAREGYYPETLVVLAPRDLLFIQQPVILAGEEWCYQGGQDYYRLASFHREFFSAPVSLRVYASAGEPPAEAWACEERLSAMKERYYSPMEDPAALRPPMPTPLPEIEVAVPKTVVQPVLDGIEVAPGSWSPDGAYFAFAAQTTTVTLHFLNGQTGEICTVEGLFVHGEGLQQHHAWLPDGRLLYLNSSGEMVALTPCRPEVEHLTDRFPETFRQIRVHAPENGRILLQSEAAYWILDGRTLTLQAIPEVTPTPYEFHWDTFAWLRGGERLAIARLNGRSGSNAGSTLYLIAGDTGQLEASLSLGHDFGQSAPWISGLSEQKLLMHGSGDLVVVDFSADPPQRTNVLADIFDLDVDYPGQASAGGAFIDKGGNGYYLAVRLNHPRSQATYLYHSESGRVDVYDHEHHTLLLFPDGQLVEMPKQETVPSFRDEYDLVVVDAPEAAQPRLVLTGHTPREYPRLSIFYLTKTSQIAAASAHGVSLVSLPEGEMVAYWDLAGPGFSPWLMVAPEGSSFVAMKGQGGLYGPLP